MVTVRDVLNLCPENILLQNITEHYLTGLSNKDVTVQHPDNLTLENFFYGFRVLEDGRILQLRKMRIDDITYLEISLYDNR